MIPISEALDIIRRETHILGSEKVSLAESVGRILAEDIVADTDLPPFDRSQMDGFAVKAKDTNNAPITLKIVGESAAGRGWHNELKTSEAVRIMTGAPVPKGADTVQKFENTVEEAGNVTINEPAKLGQFIVRQGAEIKKGSTVFTKGESITAKMIASHASFGYSRVKVAKQPRITILATGSEIVEVGRKPKKDQIRDSNSAMLGMYCAELWLMADVLPIAADDVSSLKIQISAAAKRSDILIITGGVSVGKYDLTKTVLSDLKANIFFERVRLKPGKPTVFARLGKTLIFGLPGNPVSVAVTFYLFVRTAIMLMQNASQPELRHGFAIAGKALKGTKERDCYFPASLATDKTGRLTAEPLFWQGSSDFIGFARAEALIVVPRGKTFDSGKAVKIVFL